MNISDSRYHTIYNLLESDINNSLKKLGKLSKGKTFKAEISLENLKGWFIQNVISID